MRPLPAGIRLERAGPADMDRVWAVVEEGVRSYKSWAPPDWELVRPTPERMRMLRELYAGDDAWIVMAIEADAGDEVVGVVSVAPISGANPEPPPPDTIFLWQLFVRPAWQGRGLAQALIDRATGEARRRGFDRMLLWAAEGAAQARRFYEKEGWRPTGRRDPEPRFGVPIIEYELIIRPPGARLQTPRVRSGRARPGRAR